MGYRLFAKASPAEEGHRAVMDFFESVNEQGRFLWALSSLLKGVGCVVNEDYCAFPDWGDPDPELHFTGVKIGSFDQEATVSLEEFNSLMNEACAGYLILHPEDQESLRALVSANT